jgi:hypothetical protein
LLDCFGFGFGRWITAVRPRDFDVSRPSSCMTTSNAELRLGVMRAGLLLLLTVAATVAKRGASGAPTCKLHDGVANSATSATRRH